MKRFERFSMLMIIWMIGASAFAKNESLFLMQAPSDQASIQHGKEVYEQKCIWCHGAKGDGKGPAANLVYPKPRNFSQGTFKIRTSESGQLPTDYDIYRSITEGLKGTTMYAWRKALSEKDRWALVAYLKTFSPRFQSEQYVKERVLTYYAAGDKGYPYPGDPGKADANLLKEGEQIYHDPNGAKCFQCHGDHGRGNGTSADTLTDDWNNKIWPADLTKGYDLRGGDSAQDIYRDISTGLSGSPMPSYRGALDADDRKDTHKRWALAYYVRSLQTPQKLGSLVKAVHIQGDIPSEPHDSRWNKIDWIDIPLAGQIILNPREFIPSVDNVSVKAYYNDKEIAIFMSWNDKTKNIASEKNIAISSKSLTPRSLVDSQASLRSACSLRSKFPDAAEVQFPVQIPPDPTQSARPYFVMGDKDHPVDLWDFQADQNQALEKNGWGPETVKPKSGHVLMKSVYDDGMWKVVFTRPLTTSLKDQDIQFEIGKYIPIAFSIWDGNNAEHGMKKSLSAWYTLLLVPPLSSKVYLAPFVAILFGIGLELWFTKKAKEFFIPS